jgi:hypothetical protein
MDESQSRARKGAAKARRTAFEAVNGPGLPAFGTALVAAL